VLPCWVGMPQTILENCDAIFVPAGFCMATTSHSAPPSLVLRPIMQEVSKVRRSLSRSLGAYPVNPCNGLFQNSSVTQALPLPGAFSCVTQAQNNDSANCELVPFDQPLTMDGRHDEQTEKKKEQTYALYTTPAKTCDFLGGTPIRTHGRQLLL